MAWVIRTLAAATLCANGATLAALNGSRSAPPPPLPIAVPPSAYSVATSRTIDGLFHVDGRVGAGSIDFVVDTGASVTVLTAADARRLGAVPLADHERGATLQTAGGGTAMTWRRVPNLIVAGQRLGAVDVAVLDGGLRHSLLGQDVLSRLGEIAIADDRLEIRPAATR